jgi:hypothetical protein
MSECCRPVKSESAVRDLLRAALVGVLLSYVVCASFIIGHEVVGPTVAEHGGISLAGLVQQVGRPVES